MNKQTNILLTIHNSINLYCRYMYLIGFFSKIINFKLVLHDYASFNDKSG